MDSTRLENISSEDKHLSCTYGSRYETQTISEFYWSFVFPLLQPILILFLIQMDIETFSIGRQGSILIFYLDSSDKNWEAMPHCLVTKLMTIIIHLSLHLYLHLHLEYCELKIKLTN